MENLENNNKKYRNKENNSKKYKNKRNNYKKYCKINRMIKNTKITINI